MKQSDTQGELNSILFLPSSVADPGFPRGRRGWVSLVMRLHTCAGPPKLTICTSEPLSHPRPGRARQERQVRKDQPRRRTPPPPFPTWSNGRYAGRLSCSFFFHLGLGFRVSLLFFSVWRFLLLLLIASFPFCSTFFFKGQLALAQNKGVKIVNYLTSCLAVRPGDNK